MTRFLVLTGWILALGVSTIAQTDAAATVGALKDYQPQMGRTKLLAVEDIVRKSHGDAALRTQIEQQMIALLESGATPEAKQFVCRQLWVIGTAPAYPHCKRCSSMRRQRRWPAMPKGPREFRLC